MRRLALGTALWALMAPGAAHALGLGEIEARSALNQPLRAEIQLLSVQQGEIQDLVIRLAPEALFQRMGMDRSHVLSDLQFEPITTPDGRHVVRVTSRNPVREPFLNFLIEASWPGGRLVREYTILLDPPTRFEQSQAPARTPTEAPPALAAPSRPTTPAPPPTRYRVRPGDTMWDLGARLRPDPDISVEQMMMALLQANPEAFADNNINNLLSGSVLRVPDRDDITALTAAAARREVAAQHRLWQEYRTRTVADQPPSPQRPATPDTAATVPAPQPLATATETTGRLEILADSGGVDATGAADLKQELALLRETSESRRQESLELRERVHELEALLERQSRLLALNNQQLAQLQEQLARNEAAILSGTPHITPEPLSSPAAPQAPASPPSATSPESDGWMADLLRNPALLVGGGFGILLVLALIMLTLRRLRDRADDDRAITTDALPLTDRQPASPPTPAPGAGPTTGTVVAGAGLMAAAAPPAEAEQIATDDPPATSSTEPEATLPVRVDQDDIAPIEAEAEESWDKVTPDEVIAEADVYMGYGLYQQAADLLEAALEYAPERISYQFKLAESHFGSGDQAAFDQTAARFLEQKGDQPSALWDRIVTMGQELSPDNPLYHQAGAAPAPNPFAPAGDDDDVIVDVSQLETSLSEPAPPPDDRVRLDKETVAEEPSAEPKADSIQKPDTDPIFDLEDLEFPDSTAPDHSPEKVKEEDDTLQAALEDLGWAESDTVRKELSADADRTPSGPVADGAEKPQDKDDMARLRLPEDEMTQSDLRPLDQDDDIMIDDFVLDDEVSTKLDLARAYIEMGDQEGARATLADVLEEGDALQQQQARELLQQIR
ncbi:pilus assembly protein FimV [Ectothiorhodospira magna]|uniref:Pilus assembly protein FimV n=1 Tax=Ectothiorhodospira magna TaxID=867345 RepID=A0A1H8ZSV3_9GAMM|nr:FimV/HubP family polar landmark protein [Ectothiorhodospira magna]SEP67549.1 pilus assembly protein FimV [Ectothiorhodospira magna]